MSLSHTPFSYWPSLDRELDHDFARMHRLINNATRNLPSDQRGVHHRQPNYTYEDNSENAHIEVELPGVPKENVKMDLHANTLLITAKRYKPGTTNVTVEEHHEEHTTKQPHADGKEKEVHQVEQPDPALVYQLKLGLGKKHDLDHIQASMPGDGLLTITIPIKHRNTPRPIQIQSASM